MIPIILRTLRDSLRSLLIYCLAAFGFVWMYIALFPLISEKSALLQETIASYPPEMFKAMGIDPANLLMNNIHAFVSMEYFSLLFPIMAMAMAIGTAAGSLAGETERGTIALLLSQPVSRVRLFFAKYIAGAVKLAVLSGVAVISPIALSAAYGLEYRAQNFLSVLPVCLAFSLAVYSLGFMFSAMFSEKGRVTFLTLGVVIFMYALNVLASLQESVQSLRYVSFFYYYDQGPAVVRGQIYGWHVLALLGVALVCTLVGAVIFRKKDISV